MSEYAAGIAIFLLVLSPLFIPIAVTLVGAITNWHNDTKLRSRLGNAAASASRVIVDDVHGHADVHDLDPEPGADTARAAEPRHVNIGGLRDCSTDPARLPAGSRYAMVAGAGARGHTRPDA
jgi:hypothetical protein